MRDWFTAVAHELFNPDNALFEAMKYFQLKGTPIVRVRTFFKGGDLSNRPIDKR
jgi:hypothetical protein